jgi:fused signal recognition particle receptor
MLGLFKKSEKKTEQGVKRTREAWWGKVVHLFDVSTLGDELWDELEELLISADVGVSTTAKLIERLKLRVEREGIKEPAQVRAVLKDEIVSLLTVAEPESSASENESMSVILVVGVRQWCGQNYEYRQAGLWTQRAGEEGCTGGKRYISGGGY